MKLSEVIKAIEDGSKSEFISSIYEVELKTVNGVNYAKFVTNGGNCVLLDLWEEVKPPRQWSEKEQMLFKLLPDWANWIAADLDGDIWFYDVEPRKDKTGYYSVVGQAKSLRAFDFLTITFEESPIYIGDLKGE